MTDTTNYKFHLPCAMCDEEEEISSPFPKEEYIKRMTEPNTCIKCFSIRYNSSIESRFEILDIRKRIIK